MELQKRLIEGRQQRWNYIAELKQAMAAEDWVKASRLSAELSTLDSAMKYAEEGIREVNHRRM